MLRSQSTDTPDNISANDAGFRWGSIAKGEGGATDAKNQYYGYDPIIDLSKGNHIYGSSSTVQPNSLVTQYLIKY